MNASTVVGLALMIGSETATLAHVEPFRSWNTPIAWTGFILFADGIVWRARGDSWIRSSPSEFALLSALSIPLWLVFELYNRTLHNWYYEGLPHNAALRVFGYVWSFSTIWPAIFEGAELVAVARHRASTRNDSRDGVTLPATSALSGLERFLVITGALMLASPFVVPTSIAPYMAAPVWLGFIFLLDPINRLLGEASLLDDLRSRRYGRLTNLLASGLLCGVLWEFWNYWAGAKWHYTVPIMERVKIFEMPVPGYLGFPPFALECFTMYLFIRGAIGLNGRPVGL